MSQSKTPYYWNKITNMISEYDNKIYRIIVISIFNLYNYYPDYYGL